MNPHERLAIALRRIAGYTSVIRTRSEDAIRAENHDGLNDRLEQIVTRFESLVDELEKALT